jgi:DNA-binding IclR family transcriptional regulator
MTVAAKARARTDSVPALAPVESPPVHGPSDSVLGKVRLILEAFRIDDGDISLAELARRTALPKATVHRICAELVAWGALERVGARYRLGLRLFEIGQRVPRQRVLREAALPYLEDLVLATNETVHCAVMDGGEVFYIEKLSGHRTVTRPSRMAGRMPMHCTATGKALLAFSPKETVDSVLRAGLPRRTPHSITSPLRLRAELETIRASGVAAEREECRIGFLSVAAPVFGHHSILTGAISVTAPTSRTSVERLTPSVRAAASAISRRLRSVGLGESSG